MTNKILYPNDVDLKEYANELNHNAKYGLPKEVSYCQSCVISNQRPNSAIEYNHVKGVKKETIFFDDSGICDACRLSTKKQSSIDWEQRENNWIVNQFGAKMGVLTVFAQGLRKR